MTEKKAKYMKRWRVENRDKLVHYQQRYKIKLRKACLEFYGGSPPRCGCCGERTYEFLSIDHIDGGGNKHRREIGGSGTAFYRWLVKNAFPKGFQVLCYNCNFAKGHNGTCPHER